MIKIKSQQQIKVMAESGKILKEILDHYDKTFKEQK